MNTTLLRSSCAILAIAGASSFAAPRDTPPPDRAGTASRQAAPAQRSDSAMAELPNRAVAGEPAYGWRYFSDPAAPRAVVISPAGEYFVSLGKGLQAVAGTGTRAR